jgi:hypothetical protein
VNCDALELTSVHFRLFVLSLDVPLREVFVIELNQIRCVRNEDGDINLVLYTSHY